MTAAEKNDFSKGNVYRHIIALAIPMTVAQLVQMMYNIVDRIYIGRLPGTSSMALTGLGVTFPIITIVTAFTRLFGTGGAPLCSIARGRGDLREAEKIMGNTFSMLCGSSLVLLVVCMAAMRPLLYLFGASDASYPYASEYLRIYLIGTIRISIGTGMNGFINSQGFAKEGMITIVAGALLNIVLDPLFIFVFQMGISGAAVATVLSQLASAAWVMSFLLGKRTSLRLNRESMRLDKPLVRRIMGLGTAGFVMQATNGAVQIACNTTLRNFGGDIYVAIMTVLNSVRDVMSLPAHGVTEAAQPVLGFNLGAGEWGRIKKSILFITITSVTYMAVAWLIVFLFPAPLMQVFNSNPELLAKGVPAMHIFFFGFFMMAFQSAGQTVFVGLGKSKQAIFFSLFRKIVIVVPLSLLLPYVGGLGVNGVFLAEAVSNFLGGSACYGSMLFFMSREMKKQRAAALSQTQ